MPPSQQLQDGTLVLKLQGRLDLERTRGLWEDISQRLEEPGLTGLICDLQEVKSIDTAGIALLRELESRCAGLGVQLEFQNLPKSAQHLLGHHLADSEQKTSIPEQAPSGWLTRLWSWTADKVSSVSALIEFLGSVLAAVFSSLWHPRQLRFRDIFFHVQQVGAEATWLICIINALTGVVVVYQGKGVIGDFGAPIYVAEMVARSITAQMSPVLTALLLAGRSGSSFAAKIASMKVRQELDVLAVMNMDIVKMLVLPRVLAIGLVTPLLTVLASASGILGGMLAGFFVLDLAPVAFLNQVQSTLGLEDVVMVLSKGVAFGTVIGLTGCFQGLRTGTTADSLGFRTTAAVVSSIFIIIVLNTLFAALFSTLGW
jgi:phospholipid/cholesterol/gamma-HCH transport system permease protein